MVNVSPNCDKNLQNTRRHKVKWYGGDKNRDPEATFQQGFLNLSINMNFFSFMQLFLVYYLLQFTSMVYYGHQILKFSKPSALSVKWCIAAIAITRSSYSSNMNGKNIFGEII